jgi:LuxR family transcriptional regulator, maltose regulon positive regulatory protein
MTDLPAAAGSGRAPGRAEPGLLRRHDLLAALDQAARKRVTIIAAPAGTGKTSLLRAWADRPGQDCRIAFMTVRPGQHDMQLFWLTMLDAVRTAAGTGEGGAELPPATPGSSGSAMMDKVLSELEESCDRFVLVIGSSQRY